MGDRGLDVVRVESAVKADALEELFDARIGRDLKYTASRRAGHNLPGASAHPLNYLALAEKEAAPPKESRRV
jgi:hypothetical protein